MKIKRYLMTALLLMFVSSAQSAYITDKLVAGLYEEAKVTDKPLKALNSGTPLEVISRNKNFVKVRTSDGTEGWVESTYLTDEKPARSILLDTQARLAMLQKQLEKLKAMSADQNAQAEAANIDAWQEKLARAQGQVSQLEIQLKAAKLNNKQLTDRQQQLIDRIKSESEATIQGLQTDNAALREKMNQIAAILNVPVEPVADKTAGHSSGFNALDLFADKWFWILVGLVLVMGFTGGYFYMRHRVFQRFGTAMKF